ncbi:hypothetical protein NPIL_98151 [Nephila pilipes]|uniref:Uncharacterized protein n=1 Tax=Nephila pilipes TaxID=299642 RepID=A0A8X6NE15_NEPPI|nr:hypothetical protein NPIL_98151 [Nephila pilipes]
MCPDECSAGLRMVSPVSLESRLSRPLEPLRSDLRFWKHLDGSRALGFSRLLGLSVCFRFSKCRPPFLCAVSCLRVLCFLLEDFDLPAILFTVFLWTF